MSTFTEGRWTYQSGPDGWTATHAETEQAVGPESTVVDLRRRVYEATQAANPVVTIAGGPGRALSARRYTQSFGG